MKTTSNDFSPTLALKVDGMTCASCVGRVERALKLIPGVLDVGVNLATEQANLRLAEPVDQATLIKVVTDLGYDVPATTIEIAVEGMTCASCVGRVERALESVTRQ